MKTQSRRAGRLSRPAMLALACVLSLGGLAACGDDDADDSASNSGLEGDPYVVGNLLEIKTAYTTWPAANQHAPLAFEKWVNDNGGINGRPLKVVSIDTAGDPAKGLEAAKRLIEQENVIALVGNNNSGAEAAYEDYVAESGVPVIGQAYSQIAAENPAFFQTAAGDYRVAGASRAAAAQAAGVTRYGIMYCTEVAACEQDFKSQVEASESLDGLDVVESVPAAIASPNFTTPCVQMKSAGVDGIYYSSSVEGIARAAVDCAKQGLEVIHVMGESGPDLLTTPEIYEHGAAVADLTLPYWVEDERTQNFRDAMAEYYPDDDLTSASAQVWTSFEVLKAALEQVPDEDGSPEIVKKGLYALPADFQTSMSVPLNYTEGEPSSVRCFYLSRITPEGKFELIEQDAQCAP
jgi:branched-chain amino acid transport system substrate-binding protein